MSDDRRDTFIDMAENMGLDPGEAEDMVDANTSKASRTGTITLSPRGGADAPPVLAPPRVTGKVGAAVVPSPRTSPSRRVAKPEGIRLSPGGAVKSGTVVSTAARPVMEVLDPAEERRRYPNFLTSLGTTMLVHPDDDLHDGQRRRRRARQRAADDPGDAQPFPHVAFPDHQRGVREIRSRRTLPGAARGRTIIIR